MIARYNVVIAWALCVSLHDNCRAYALKMAAIWLHFGRRLRLRISLLHVAITISSLILRSISLLIEDIIYLLITFHYIMTDSDHFRLLPPVHNRRALYTPHRAQHKWYASKAGKANIGIFRPCVLMIMWGINAWNACRSSASGTVLN